MTAAAKSAEPDAPASESKSAKKDKAYKVVAPLIAVPIGESIMQFYVGDILPNGIARDSLDHHLGLGLIAEND